MAKKSKLHTISREDLETLVDEMVEQRLQAKMRRDCFTCRHFTFKVEDGVERENEGNRGCRYPKDIEVHGQWTDAVCLSWELQLDPRKRKRSFISYYPER